MALCLTFDIVLKRAYYVVGHAKGRKYSTKVTVGGSLEIENQLIGVADTYDDEYELYPLCGA